MFRHYNHQLRCFLATNELRPHAERGLEAAEEARRAMQSVAALETGTIRFGMFGTARLYAGAALIADVLERHPGVRVALIGQNSSEVQEDLRRGRIEAAMLAVPQVNREGLQVTPVARDELVYISADPEHLQAPVTAARLARAQLVMPETTWRAEDSTRVVLRKMLETGLNPAYPHRGRGRRDRCGAGRPRPGRLRGASGRGRAAAAPAGAGRRADPTDRQGAGQSTSASGTPPSIR